MFHCLFLTAEAPAVWKKLEIGLLRVSVLTEQDVFPLLVWDAGRSHHGCVSESCGRRNNAAGGERDCGSSPGDVSAGQWDPGAEEKFEADGDWTLQSSRSSHEPRRRGHPGANCSREPGPSKRWEAHKLWHSVFAFRHTVCRAWQDIT